MENRRDREVRRFGIGEWYGFLFTHLTEEQRREFAAIQSLPKKERLPMACPFQSVAEREVACSKAGGVCSLRLYASSGADRVEAAEGEEGSLRTVCPNRFEEGGLVYRWVGKTLLDCNSPITVREIGFLGAVPGDDGGDPDAQREVSRIDKVLVVPGSEPLRWCALEAQAVYFQGSAMGADFRAIARHKGANLPFPHARRQPDYRSSGPKRLMPQLQIKVPSLRRWGKKMAVVVDRGFFSALAPMRAVSDVSNCDIAWFVVDYDLRGRKATMLLSAVHLTTLENAVEGITAGLPVSLHTFEQRLRGKLLAQSRNPDGL